MASQPKNRPLLDLRSVELELELLTPLHIGAGGQPLLGNYDVVADTQRGRYYLIDLDRLITERMTEEQLARGQDPRVDNLITPQEWEAYARAILRGPSGQQIAPESRERWTLLPFERNASGHPYLPGSSFKGALRTALAYHFLRDQLRQQHQVKQSARLTDTPVGKQLRDQLNKNRKSREWFARPLETLLFQQSEGFDPNHDLLRVVRPSDSKPLPPDATVVEQVGIYQLRGQELRLLSPKHRWLVETLPEKTRLRLRLDFDFGPFGARRGLPEDRRAAVDLPMLLRACREFAYRLVSLEVQTLSRDTRSAVRSFYQSLAQEIKQAKHDEAYLQLGWGTGWRAKTIGPLLELSTVEDGLEFLDALIRNLRLDRTGHGRPFPRTRRFVERQGRPVFPLGWVRVRVVS